MFASQPASTESTIRQWYTSMINETYHVINCHELSSSVVKCPLMSEAECPQLSSSVINCQIAWTCLDSEVFERESLAWREDKGAKPLAFILPLLDTSDEYPKDDWLVVWNMFYDFPYIGNVIIPTDELIFFRGIGQPPTRWSLMIFNDRFPLFDESQEFTLVKTMVYPFIAIPSVHFFEHGQNSTNDGIRHFCDWKVLDLAPGKMPDTCSCAACTVNCFDVTSGYQWFTSGYQVHYRKWAVERHCSPFRRSGGTYLSAVVTLNWWKGQFTQESQMETHCGTTTAWFPVHFPMFSHWSCLINCTVVLSCDLAIWLEFEVTDLPWFVKEADRNWGLCLTFSERACLRKKTKKITEDYSRIICCFPTRSAASHSTTLNRFKMIHRWFKQFSSSFQVLLSMCVPNHQLASISSSLSLSGH